MCRHGLRARTQAGNFFTQAEITLRTHEDASCSRRKCLYEANARFIAAHDEWLGAKHHYTVIHCVAPLPHRAAAFEGLELVQRYYDDDAEVVLRPIREFFRMQDLEATFVHEIGYPAECIAAVAEGGGYELLVLGSHGHGALASLTLGSVATKVLALCRTPVLLIR